MEKRHYSSSVKYLHIIISERNLRKESNTVTSQDDILTVEPTQQRAFSNLGKNSDLSVLTLSLVLMVLPNWARVKHMLHPHLAQNCPYHSEK